MTNYPDNLTARDYAHIEGHNLTDADRDDLRGQDWLRSLTLPEHSAMPRALDPGGHVFQATCRCRWKGPVHRSYPATGLSGKALHNLNTKLWLDAAADADKHNEEMGTA